jgi:hypothetical protein
MWWESIRGRPFFAEERSSVMIKAFMSAPVISKILFTVTFPNQGLERRHIPGIKLHSLAKRQLSDLDVIETIDHLFRCQRCFETYRHVRNSYVSPWSARISE